MTRLIYLHLFEIDARTSKLVSTLHLWPGPPYYLYRFERRSTSIYGKLECATRQLPACTVHSNILFRFFVRSQWRFLSFLSFRRCNLSYILHMRLSNLLMPFVVRVNNVSRFVGLSVFAVRVYCNNFYLSPFPFMCMGYYKANRS